MSKADFLAENYNGLLSSQRRVKMGYTKKELIKRIANSKKIIRLLNKLQRLCWSTIEVGTWVLIEREKTALATYQKKLRNGEYAK